MDAADVLADHLERLDRFAATVEDHVGRVEVDEQVVSIDIREKLEQRIGRFLPRFQVERLAVAGTVTARLADHFHHLGIVG